MASFGDQREQRTFESESLLESSPIPQELTDKLFGFCASQAIITGFKLGIFDAIHYANDAITSKEISKKLQTNEDATVRLLDTLVSLDLLQKAAKNGAAVYNNTITSERFLVQSSPNSIQGIVPMLEKSYKLYENLDFAVREGKNQWRRTFNGFFARLVFMAMDVYEYLVR